MGACYSKGSVAANHLKQKAPRFRKHDSKNKQEPIIDEVELGDDDFEQKQENYTTNDSSHLMVNGGNSNSVSLPNTTVFPDLVSDLEDQSGENMTVSRASIVDKGVAPSDSGIESIGLFSAEDGILAEENSANLSTKLERLSRGSCHKCGNFKLDDNALTALLSNTYCLCGPRQAGKPSINPDCQTHGVKRDFKRSQSMPAKCGGEHTQDVRASSSPLKSNLKRRSDIGRRDKTLRISLENNLDQEFDYSDICEDKNILNPKNTSIDDVFDENNDKEHKRLSRRSLLSEILDITDSICKCDFYSNEYCVGHANSEGNNNSIGNSNNDNVNDTLESLALSGSAANSNCDISTNNYIESESPSKKSASLSKFVTFAKEKESGVVKDVTRDNGSRSCPISPLKRQNCSSNVYNSLSETSSGIDMHSVETSGGSILSPNLTKSDHLLATPSYEAVDRTEDDMASIDMDSLSRVTSLSYGSIRQLLESTEDLVEPMDSVRRMTIDGEDCVIIPTNTYKQMQSDLTMLKEQLVCLSSLLQEENDPRNRKSLSFYSDLDATPTQRRIQFRSQEFVDMLSNDQ